MTAFKLWGRLAFVILPLCSCLSIDQVVLDTSVVHPVSYADFTVYISPPTTEGLEEGQAVYGLLAIEIPQGWSFVSGSWAIDEGVSGTIINSNVSAPSSPAENADWEILSSDRALSRYELGNPIKAIIRLRTGKTTGYYDLYFTGGVTDGSSSRIWSWESYRIGLEVQ